MSLQACADIVAKGDPDRFRAVMAAPVDARQVLFPLYAFNVEVARAPWVGSEPMIGEMRLHWWRDAVEESGAGRTVRKHEVTTPLADVLDAKSAQMLDRGGAARRWDLYKDPFEDEDHLVAYLENTGGTLMWVAALALGAPDAARDAVRGFGTATALTRFLAAVPALEARGRIPLVDGRKDGIVALVERIRATSLSLAELKRAIPKAAQPARFYGWETGLRLCWARRAPERVADGTLQQSEFRKRLGLILALA